MSLIIGALSAIAGAILGAIVSYLLRDVELPLNNLNYVIGVIVAILVLALVASLPLIHQNGISLDTIPTLTPTSEPTLSSPPSVTPLSAPSVTPSPTPSAISSPTPTIQEEDVVRAPFLASDPKQWVEVSSLSTLANLPLYEAGYASLGEENVLGPLIPFEVSQKPSEGAPIMYRFTLWDVCEGTGELSAVHVSLIKFTSTNSAAEAWDEHRRNVMEQRLGPVKNINIGNIGYEHRVFPLARLYCDGDFLAAYAEVTFQRYNAVAIVIAESRIVHSLEEIKSSERTQEDTFEFTKTIARQIDTQLSQIASAP